jgi:myo-inositol-1-phosphate synthase
MSKIKIAIVGIGNCASSLIQGIHYYGAIYAHPPERDKVTHCECFNTLIYKQI